MGIHESYLISIASWWFISTDLKRIYEKVELDHFSQIGSLHPNVGMKIKPKTHISKHQLQFLFRKLEGWIRAT